GIVTQILLAGNTVNSRCLALNSFPRPKVLQPNSELIGRNLMVHVRGNFIWIITRTTLGVQSELERELQTTALHIPGSTQTDKGPGQFHFQFYAAPNIFTPAFPGAPNNPEEFLYRVVPNIEEFEKILAAQTSGRIENKVVIRIRTCGETFGDRTTPIGKPNSSWINVNPFDGTGNDLYFENGRVRVPKAFINLVETPADKQV
ncbi:hypothetical protein AAFM79_23815, partial [Trichormus azollae HNT15244]